VSEAATPGIDRFAQDLLAWFARHGRTDLPWQREPTPYRVWVSEVMLQQTQVRTVIPYFERFTARFPDVAALAGAELDEVLHLWSGLGYYARARHLHRGARLVCERHGGELPADIESLAALPGIGRSTAGAILALARGQRHPILDGNVRRVLCRYHGIEAPPEQAATAKRLWALAEAHTPRRHVAAYTQAVMDLGATVCTRTRPRCGDCPVARRCRARLEGRAHALPARRRRRERPVRATRFLIVRDARGRVLLERRAPAGVWGGLWAFPEGEPGTEPAAWCRRRLGREPARLARLPVVRHGFTHFELHIEPVLVDLDGRGAGAESLIMEGAPARWYDPAAPERLGLAAPVQALLEGLHELDRKEPTWPEPSTA